MCLQHGPVVPGIRDDEHDHVEVRVAFLQGGSAREGLKIVEDDLGLEAHPAALEPRVRIDGAVVSDRALKVPAGTFVLQVGKRKFARVTLR